METIQSDKLEKLLKAAVLNLRYCEKVWNTIHLQNNYQPSEIPDFITSVIELEKTTPI